MSKEEIIGMVIRRDTGIKDEDNEVAFRKLWFFFDPQPSMRRVMAMMDEWATVQTTTLSLIRPLAFADHSSVEYNMEEIRKILNEMK